jgi:hypothetical protein
MEIIVCCERMGGSVEVFDSNFRVNEETESVDLHADDGKLVFANIDHCPFCGKTIEIE